MDFTPEGKGRANIRAVGSAGQGLLVQSLLRGQHSKCRTAEPFTGILQPPAPFPSLGFVLWLRGLDTSDEVGAELEEAELAL